MTEEQKLLDSITSLADGFKKESESTRGSVVITNTKIAESIRGVEAVIKTGFLNSKKDTNATFSSFLDKLNNNEILKEKQNQLKKLTDDLSASKRQLKKEIDKAKENNLNVEVLKRELAQVDARLEFIEAHKDEWRKQKEEIQEVVRKQKKDAHKVEAEVNSRFKTLEEEFELRLKKYKTEEEKADEKRKKELRQKDFEESALVKLMRGGSKYRGAKGIVDNLLNMAGLSKAMDLWNTGQTIYKSVFRKEEYDSETDSWKKNKHWFFGRQKELKKLDEKIASGKASKKQIARADILRNELQANEDRLDTLKFENRVITSEDRQAKAKLRVNKDIQHATGVDFLRVKKVKHNIDESLENLDPVAQKKLLTSLLGNISGDFTKGSSLADKFSSSVEKANAKNGLVFDPLTGEIIRVDLGDQLRSMTTGEEIENVIQRKNKAVKTIANKNTKTLEDKSDENQRKEDSKHLGLIVKQGKDVAHHNKRTYGFQRAIMSILKIISLKVASSGFMGGGGIGGLFGKGLKGLKGLGGLFGRGAGALLGGLGGKLLLSGALGYGAGTLLNEGSRWLFGENNGLSDVLGRALSKVLDKNKDAGVTDEKVMKAASMGAGRKNLPEAERRKNAEAHLKEFEKGWNEDTPIDQKIKAVNAIEGIHNVPGFTKEFVDKELQKIENGEKWYESKSSFQQRRKKQIDELNTALKETQEMENKRNAGGQNVVINAPSSNNVSNNSNTTVAGGGAVHNPNGVLDSVQRSDLATSNA